MLRDACYAVQLDSVVEVIKVRDGQLKSIQSRKVVLYRDGVVPVVILSRLFEAADDWEQRASAVVICRTADGPVGLCVDAVLGQENIVIKHLGQFLRNAQWIAGATIRGDGKVALVLDISAILKHVRSTGESMRTGRDHAFASLP